MEEIQDLQRMRIQSWQICCFAKNWPLELQGMESKYMLFVQVRKTVQYLCKLNIQVHQNICDWTFAGWVKTNLARYMDLGWKNYAVMIPAAFILMRNTHQVFSKK